MNQPRLSCCIVLTETVCVYACMLAEGEGGSVQARICTQVQEELSFEFECAMPGLQLCAKGCRQAIAVAVVLLYLDAFCSVLIKPACVHAF